MGYGPCGIKGHDCLKRAKAKSLFHRLSGLREQPALGWWYPDNMLVLALALSSKPRCERVCWLAVPSGLGLLIFWCQQPGWLSTHSANRRKCFGDRGPCTPYVGSPAKTQAATFILGGFLHALQLCSQMAQRQK